MARTDTVGETLASDDDSPVEFDVAVVGGGAAGLSAAVYLARYGFETVVFARGKSAIEQCAHLENYLGFPAGIKPRRLLALGRDQVEHEGGVVREERVDEVREAALDPAPQVGTGFTVETDEDSYTTGYVLAATAYDGEMFEAFETDLETEETYGMVDSSAGRTSVDGLYAAGWMTDETVHQAIVSAGHGAQAAISLVRDDLSARYWPAVADQYVDWVVHDGRYGGEDWDEHTRGWFEREILPADEAVDPDLAEAALAHLKSEFRDREIDAEERNRRDREGQRRLLERLDDDVVREYVEESTSTTAEQ